MSKKGRQKGQRRAGNKNPKERNSRCRMKRTPQGPKCIDFWGDSDAGMVRTNNEDALIIQNIWGNKAVLAVAIDGLGGYEGGEVAAEIARREIVTYLEASDKGNRLELLKQAVTCANNAIFKASQEDARYHQMGCVLSAVIIDLENKEVNMAHVGDSRLYVFRNGMLTKLSHDHSYVGFCEETGDLTEEQAMHHPNRNVVDRVIGQESHLASDNNFIESAVFPLEPLSVFLLCSDGLTDMITTTTISNILSCDYSLKEKVKALIKAALDAGGKDNVTVVLVDYRGDKQEEQKKEHAGGIQQIAEEDDETKRMTAPRHPINWVVAIICLVLGFCVGFFVGSKRPCQSCDQKETMQPEVKAIQVDSCESMMPIDTTTYTTVIDSLGNG